VVSRLFNRTAGWLVACHKCLRKWVSQAVMEKWIEKVENRLWTFHVKVLCLHLCREIMASVLVYSFH
jgi:hypothetical protein